MTSRKIVIPFRHIAFFSISMFVVSTVFAAFEITDNFTDHSEAFASTSIRQPMVAQELSVQSEFNPIAEQATPAPTVLTPDFRDDYIVIRAAIDERFPGYPEAEKFTIARSILRWSHAYSIDPLLVAAIVDVESNFKPTASSSKDAQGLMQIRTPVGALIAKSLKIKYRGVSTLRDIDTNIRMGVSFFAYLKKSYRSVKLALAAYNIGPGYVDSRRRIGLDPDGRYARKVFGRYIDLHQFKIDHDQIVTAKYLASLAYGFKDGRLD
jgi:soluble lytic murein transglycosylase-like protein